jgi:WXXGXW repeat (2 copies)
VLHFCWINCATLTLENGRYVRTDGTDESWTIERFTPTSVVMRRHDVPAAWNGFSTDVTYQGQVSNERLINVTINGNPVPDINISWGAALDALPGSNAERDQRKLAQSRKQAIDVSPPPPANFEPGGDMEMRAAEAPPPLLNDEQPPCAEDGYLWTPGYWAWRGGYYWVRGSWVRPPQVGVMWTPGYWEYAGAIYAFHPGYWGPHIGFYGGINYGFGYGGVGFAGGHWVGNSFAYNRTVSNVDASVIHHTYSEAVINHVTINKVSYNGGPGGTMTAATMQERAAAAEPHIPPTALQRQITQQAAMNPALMARANEGHVAARATVARASVHSAPRAVVANSSGAPVSHSTAAPGAVDPPNRAHSPPETTQPQGSSVQPAASKPAGAKPTKPQPNPKR